MSKLEILITERKKELQELEDNSGTRFPVIEQATEIQIAYITKELSDLEMLQEHEDVSLNENQQIVLDCLTRNTVRTSQPPISVLEFLRNLGDFEVAKTLKQAYESLSIKQQFQVLQAFAEWELGHERN